MGTVKQLYAEPFVDNNVDEAKLLKYAAIEPGRVNNLHAKFIVFVNQSVLHKWNTRVFPIMDDINQLKSLFQHYFNGMRNKAERIAKIPHTPDLYHYLLDGDISAVIRVQGNIRTVLSVYGRLSLNPVLGTITSRMNYNLAMPETDIEKVGKLLIPNYTAVQEDSHKMYLLERFNYTNVIYLLTVYDERKKAITDSKVIPLSKPFDHEQLPKAVQKFVKERIRKDYMCGFLISDKPNMSPDYLDMIAEV